MEVVCKNLIDVELPPGSLVGYTPVKSCSASIL